MLTNQVVIKLIDPMIIGKLFPFLKRLITSLIGSKKSI